MKTIADKCAEAFNKLEMTATECLTKDSQRRLNKWRDKAIEARFKPLKNFPGCTIELIFKDGSSFKYMSTFVSERVYSIQAENLKK